MKKCTKCGEYLPETSEYFQVASGYKGGFSTECKKCKAKRMKKYHADNSEHFAEVHKKYRQEHLEEILENGEKYYYDNKEKNKDYVRQYRLLNRESTLVYQKKYREENRELINRKRTQWRLNNIDSVLKKEKERRIKYQERNRVRGRLYYKLNKESCKKRNKEYKNNHLEERRIETQRRNAKKLSLPHTFTIEQWDDAKIYFNNECVYCGEIKPLTQDHYMPLSRGGEYTKDNIVPACQGCNSSKHAKLPLLWYREQLFYEESREKKILQYLGYEGFNQQLNMF